MFSARGFIVMVTLAVGALLFIAEDPRRLEEMLEEKAKPRETTTVALPPAPETKAPEPVADTPTVDPLAALAPESFATDSLLADTGFGTTFGSGGGGPGIAGGGGFGSGAQSLVQDQTNLDRPARVVSRPPLDYPAEAKARGVQGHVILKINVGANGNVEGVQISESNPPGFFDEAALRSVRQWRFEPAVIKGQVALSSITQKIRFEMD